MKMNEGKLNWVERLHCYHRLARYTFRTEPDTGSFIREFVGRGDTCLDIGAHKGVVTHMLVREAGSEGSVIAFEPQLELQEWLERMMATFRFQNVKLEKFALAASSGELKLFRAGSGKSGSMSESHSTGNEAVTIPAQTLDQYCKEQGVEHLDFIKIDVDGFEIEVLRGSEETLAKLKPVLLIEVFDRDLETVSSFLSAFGYGEPTFEHRGRRYPASETSRIPHRHEGAEFRNFLYQAE
jgi:FkbM family methyltransferase